MVSSATSDPQQIVTNSGSPKNNKAAEQVVDIMVDTTEEPNTLGCSDYNNKSSADHPGDADQAVASTPCGEKSSSVSIPMLNREVKVDVSDAEDPFGCIYINAYCRSFHKERLLCTWTKEKGRILTANEDYEEGDVIFQEPPLHIVSEDRKNLYASALNKLWRDSNPSLDYEPLWYWCALNSLTDEDLKNRKHWEPKRKAGDSDIIEEEAKLNPITKDQQKKLLLLYHGEVTEPSQDVVQIVEALELGTDPLLLEKLLQVWILNCFEHSEEPLGYSTYFMSSFMSHSCLPNVVWHYTEESVFVLRARRRIKKGDEICCSYLAEEALLESADARKTCLEESKHFTCTCERCLSGQDFSRGFLCPWCKVGTVFPAINFNPEDEANKNKRGALCNNCDAFDYDRDYHDLVQAERRIEKDFKTFESSIEKANKTHGGNAGTAKCLTEAKISALLERANEVFSQHWLHDKLWGVAQDYYDQVKDYRRAIHYARLRINFHKFAYPGCNGAHAWTMESLGELLFRYCRKEGKDSNYYEQAIKEFENAMHILGVMFGDTHEYWTTVNQKRLRVMKKLEQQRRQDAQAEKEIEQDLNDVQLREVDDSDERMAAGKGPGEPDSNNSPTNEDGADGDS